MSIFYSAVFSYREQSKSFNYYPLRSRLHIIYRSLLSHEQDSKARLLIMSKNKEFKATEKAELLAGATGAVIAADQILQSADSNENQLEHLAKAGAGAAVAIGAWEMLRRSRNDPDSHAHGGHSDSHHHSRRSSSSSNPPHHNLHLLEEIIGAYSLGKELLGDKHHHIAHLVGETIGVLGLGQEVLGKEKEQLIEERRSK